MQASSCACTRNGVAAPMRFAAASGKRASRGSRLVVQAKVDLKGGPRVLRGKCFVTKDVSLLCLSSLSTAVQRFGPPMVVLGVDNGLLSSVLLHVCFERWRGLGNGL